MYLLDTNVLIYYLYDEELPDKVTNAISTDDVFVSIASLWEIAIKQSIGKLEIRDSIVDIARNCVDVGFRLLNIKPEHLDIIRTLPNIHRDPFDRLIAAQALSESLVLITSDETLPKYPIKVLW